MSHDSPSTKAETSLLLALPTEILHQIICETRPSAFEAVILSCKKLYNIGKDLLPQHHAYCRQYRHWNFAQHRLRGKQNSRRLLLAIHKDPIIAEYIETAVFCSDDASDEAAVEALHGESEESFAALGAVWAKTPAIRDTFTTWSQGFQDVHGWDTTTSIMATMVLLALLPNVQRFSMLDLWASLPPPMGNNDSDEREPCWKLFDTIAEAAYETRILQNIERIEFTHPIQTNLPMSLQYASPFMLVPSLTELFIFRCHATRRHHNGKPFNWRYGSRVSNVRKVTLVEACVDGAQLARFLRRCPHLDTFHFTYASKRHGLGSDWDVHEFMTAIVDNCADSLTDLSVSIATVTGSLRTGIRSQLQRLYNLQKLEIEPHFWFGPVPTTSEIAHLSPKEYRDYAVEVRWKGTMLPNLTSLLPRSIQSVRLMTNSYREDMAWEDIHILRGMFEDFDRASLPCLEKLDVVRVGQSLPSDAEVQPHHARPQAPHVQRLWGFVGEMVKRAGGAFSEVPTHVFPEWWDPEWTRAR